MHAELKKYLEESLQKKKGLTFHLNGTTMVGYVTRIIDDNAIEVVNREISKGLIFTDQIHALEMS